MIGTIGLIARRDFVERLRSRAFILSTAVTVLMVGAFLLLPSLLGDEAATLEIGTLADAPDRLEEQLRPLLGPGTELTIVALPDRGTAEAALRDGTVALVVTGPDQIVYGEGSDERSRELTRAALATLAVVQRAADMGLDADQLAGLFGGPEISLEPVDPGRDAGEEAAAIGFSLFITIVMFIVIVSYGQWILIGVVEEKSNRVVEMVLGTVRAHHLLTGKVLGIGALALGQVLLIGAVAAAILPRTDLELPAGGLAGAAWGLVWFALGFGFYATAYAAAGSLVNRQEEAQNAAFPLTMVLMGAYFGAVFSLEGGTNPVLEAMTFIPPFAPIVVPLRIARSAIAPWEVAVALVLMVATTYLLIRLAGRIYRGGLLGSGGKMKLREAWRRAIG